MEEDRTSRPTSYWREGAAPWIAKGATRGRADSPMGVVAEALPPCESGEVEIACLSIRSTTGDLVSVRARRVEGLIRYRAVDEYEGEEDLAPTQAERPLSLLELGQLLCSIELGADGGLLQGLWAEELDAGYPEDEAVDRVAVSSPFYPSVSAEYVRLFQSWLQARG